MQVAAVWAAHMGIDRVAGDGPKYEPGFKHTHLSSEPDIEARVADPGSAP